MDEQPKASRFEIHVGGILSERLLGAFPDLRARTTGGMTVLVGDMPDQAALHGVLSRIESLGLELVEVRRATARTDVSRPVRQREPADTGVGNLAAATDSSVEAHDDATSDVR